MSLENCNGIIDINDVNEIIGVIVDKIHENIEKKTKQHYFENQLNK